MIVSGRYQAARQMSEEGIEEWEVSQEDVSSISVEFQRRFEQDPLVDLRRKKSTPNQTETNVRQQYHL